MTGRFIFLCVVPSCSMTKLLLLYSKAISGQPGYILNVLYHNRLPIQRKFKFQKLFLTCPHNPDGSDPLPSRLSRCNPPKCNIIKSLQSPLDPLSIRQIRCIPVPELLVAFHIFIWQCLTATAECMFRYAWSQLNLHNVKTRWRRVTVLMSGSGDDRCCQHDNMTSVRSDIFHDDVGT